MGRRPLKMLSEWRDCERCPRHAHRLGVVAPDWTRRPAVLVIGLRPDRVSQGLVAISPRVVAFGRELAAALQIPAEEVEVDSLVACGLGHQIASDHVAACSRRFVENIEKYGAPRVVVVVGAHAQSAVLGAGLISGENWHLVGSPPVPAIRWRAWAVTRELIAYVEQAMNRSVRARTFPAEDLATAERLLGSLGWADGSASREVSGASWKRRKWSPLTVERVAQHLRGKRYWGAFRPRGDWPFVVIDVDRHDALQDAEFAATLRALKNFFPKSFFVESSANGGVHVYVRLPAGTTYDEGATWLEAFLALNNLLVLEKHVSRGSGGSATLRSARLEVPRHPVRLPFGHGSHILKPKKSAPPGSSRRKKTAAMVDEFVDWIANTPATDYEGAKAFVEKKTGRAGTWSYEKKKSLEQVIAAAHLDGLKPVRLHANDPWVPVVADLDPTLRIIATRGVPAMGTRTRYTIGLVDALFVVVPPDQVEDLMLHWIQSRAHQSEDIETDPISVEGALKKTIAKKKKSVHGVPVRVADAAEESLLRASAILKTAAKPGWMLPPKTAKALRPLLQPGTVDELRERHVLLRKTLFFVLRGFFDSRTRKTDGTDGERPISRREFSRFLPNNMRAAVKEYLVLAGCLRISGEYKKGESSRKYKLGEELWPALPGEPLRFVPSP